MSCQACEARPVAGLEVCRAEDRGSPSHSHITPRYCENHLVTAALMLQLTGQLVTVVAPLDLHGDLVAAGVEPGLIFTAQEILDHTSV